MQHYADHGNEFGAANTTDYEKLADAFWIDPKPAHMRECRRRQGDIVRFDPVTQACSIIDSKSMIRTFFKPVPCASLPLEQRAAVKSVGRCHGYSDNLIYFQMECKRW